MPIFQTAKLAPEMHMSKGRKKEGPSPLGARTNVNFGSRFCQRKKQKKTLICFFGAGQKKNRISNFRKNLK